MINFRESYLVSTSFLSAKGKQRVSIVWMSRAQNYTVVSICTAPDWACIEVSEFLNNSIL